MKAIWVFGAGRSIGLECVKHFLSLGHRVTAFSRTFPPVQDQRLTALKVDFSDVPNTRGSIEHWLEHETPDAAVFCQRYRAPAGVTEVEAIKAAADVELGPAVILAGLSPSTNLVMLSSVAGVYNVSDQPLSYHVAKAGAITAARRLKANRVILADVDKNGEWPGSPTPADIAAFIGRIVERGDRGQEFSP